MSIDTDYAVLRHVLTGLPVRGCTTVGNSPDPSGGWAAEFGVYSGYSMSIIAEHMPVIGFDSFKGLPEDWRPGFPKGRFAKPEPTREGFFLRPFRTMIVPGWFKDTVPNFPFPGLGLVHIDCDLYSSTVTALEGVANHIYPGTIFVFDEYHGYEGSEQHEEKAWQEFIVRHGITAEKIAHGDQEAAFVVHDIYTPGSVDLGAV